MKQAFSPVIIDPIPFSVDETALLDRLHVDDTFVLIDDIRRLAVEAGAIARPKGVYGLCAVEQTGEKNVSLNGVAFTSRVLRVNLAGVHRAFPFLATCGHELDAWAASLNDPILEYYADAIKELALQTALQALGKRLVEAFAPGKRAVMNPGSLPDWPISEQRPLFALFGDAAAAIGVTLTESFLMSPVKSVSGLWFETDQGFVNCQLCPREGCPNRKAPHNPDLMEQKYL